MVDLTDRIRNAMINAAVDEVDVGVGANGTIEVGDAGFATVLVIFNFAATAFGASSAGTAIAASLPLTATAAATGTAAAYRIKDKDGVILWSGTDVGTSGNELVLSTTSTTSGQSIDLNICQLLIPAS